MRIATILALTPLPLRGGEWQDLFNGRDLAGRWKAGWRVEAQSSNIRIRNLDLP